MTIYRIVWFSKNTGEFVVRTPVFREDDPAFARQVADELAHMNGRPAYVYPEEIAVEMLEYHKETEAAHPAP